MTKLNLLKNLPVETVAHALACALDSEAHLCCLPYQTRQTIARLAIVRARIRAYQFLLARKGKDNSIFQSLVAWVKKDLCY